MKTPLLKDLSNYIIPWYASRWKKICEGLGLTPEVANSIELDHQGCHRQCLKMLQKWLQVKADNATWKKLLEILDSPDVYISQTDHS